MKSTPFPSTLAAISYASADRLRSSDFDDLGNPIRRKSNATDYVAKNVAGYRFPDGSMEAAHNIFRPYLPEGAEPGLVDVLYKANIHPDGTYWYEGQVQSFKSIEDLASQGISVDLTAAALVSDVYGEVRLIVADNEEQLAAKIEEVSAVEVRRAPIDFSKHIGGALKHFFATATFSDIGIFAADTEENLSAMLREHFSFLYPSEDGLDGILKALRASSSRPGIQWQIAYHERPRNPELEGRFPHLTAEEIDALVDAWSLVEGQLTTLQSMMKSYHVKSIGIRTDVDKNGSVGHSPKILMEEGTLEASFALKALVHEAYDDADFSSLHCQYYTGKVIASPDDRQTTFLDAMAITAQNVSLLIRLAGAPSEYKGTLLTIDESGPRIFLDVGADQNAEYMPLDQNYPVVNEFSGWRPIALQSLEEFVGDHPIITDLKDEHHKMINDTLFLTDYLWVNREWLDSSKFTKLTRETDETEVWLLKSTSGHPSDTVIAVNKATGDCIGGIYDETIAISEDVRGKGIGSLLLRAVYDVENQAALNPIAYSIEGHRTRLAAHREAVLEATAIGLSVGCDLEKEDVPSL